MKSTRTESTKHLTAVPDPTAEPTDGTVTSPRLPNENLPADTAPLAPLWRRLAATIYDILLLLVVNAIIGAAALFLAASKFLELPDPAMPNPFADPAVQRTSMIFAACAVAINWLLFIVLESTALRGTVGKKVFGIETVTLSGSRVPLWRSHLRFIAKLVTLATGGSAGVSYFFSQHRQTLHDFIARTKVILRAD